MANTGVIAMTPTIVENTVAIGTTEGGTPLAAGLEVLYLWRLTVPSTYTTDQIGTLTFSSPDGSLDIVSTTGLTPSPGPLTSVQNPDGTWTDVETTTWTATALVRVVGPLDGSGTADGQLHYVVRGMDAGLYDASGPLGFGAGIDTTASPTIATSALDPCQGVALGYTAAREQKVRE
ncbi:hypothetical protein JSY14_05085 [Brachybacterium sp. EF45031]|uniref:hypothetical protein n=1 Tax=Brachybacterium sillae TaxID=2810536 RepID=UPI00217EEC0F|nr:hypothetical protein [Brachybacterium sillae]MCS6711426.1 hypothetical protein [Brachybacterium sillae]